MCLETFSSQSLFCCTHFGGHFDPFDRHFRLDLKVRVRLYGHLSAQGMHYVRGGPIERRTCVSGWKRTAACTFSDPDSGSVLLKFNRVSYLLQPVITVSSVQSREEGEQSQRLWGNSPLQIITKFIASVRDVVVVSRPHFVSVDFVGVWNWKLN